MEEGTENNAIDVNLKKVCVLQRGSRSYYPKSIPRERSPLATNICIIVIVVLIFGDLFTNENQKVSVLALYVLSMLILIGLELIHRVILVFEEVKHLESRYDNSYLNVLNDAFHFPIKVCVSTCILLFYSICYYYTNNFFHDYQFGFKRIVFLLLPSVYLLGIILGLKESPLHESLWIAKNNGLDYGSGMGYSFFHGYLKLVLPKTGTEEKNIKELMQDYEDQNQIQFAVYKLFVLLPKSLNCFVSLIDHSPSIEESSSLPSKSITVAGVQKRVYKNAVYKINSKKTKEKIYVSAEYATPLKTFKDVFHTIGEHSEYYEKYKNDIILQFYQTVYNILQKTGLDQFCELIYYDDCYKDKDGIVQYYDVGKIILTRLKELKKHREKNE